jgi:hypothetical protein
MNDVTNQVPPPASTPAEPPSNVARTLLTTLGVGSLVTLAGGALTLMYFWTLGGVPFGQAGNITAMAGVVMPTALFLFSLLLGPWLAPMWMGLATADDKRGTATLNFAFVEPDSPADQTPGLHIWRLFLFAALAVFPGNLMFMVLAVKDILQGWSIAVALVAWVAVLSAVLLYLWHRWGGKPVSSQLAKDAGPNPWYWLGQGFVVAVFSFMPLGVLLLLAIQSANWQGDGALMQLFWFAGAIVVALWVSLVVTYAAYLKRKPGQAMNWAPSLSINAGLLFAVMLALGVSGRLLDVTMVLSSVRAERVNLTLTEEGCGILSAMGASGLRRVPKDGKTCVLYGVTVQSALAPSVQVACHRHPGASPTAADANQKAAKPNEKHHFTLPHEHVLSIWKPREALKEPADVCPLGLPEPETSASASPAASGVKGGTQATPSEGAAPVAAAASGASAAAVSK